MCCSKMVRKVKEVSKVFPRCVDTLASCSLLVKSINMANNSIIMANNASIIMPKNTIYYSYQLVIVTPVGTWRLPHGLEYTGVQVLAPLPRCTCSRLLCLYVYVCVCLYECMYVCMYIRTYAAPLHVHKCIYIHICIRIYIYAYICIHIYTYIHTQIYIYIYIYIYLYMYIYIYIYMIMYITSSYSVSHHHCSLCVLLTHTIRSSDLIALSLTKKKETILL